MSVIFTVFRTVIPLVMFLLVSGCASTQHHSIRGGTETGIASFYAEKYHGKKTASGEIFDMNKLTAAHRTLPFGQKVRVTNLSNNREVIVRINDRGPYAKDRIIDVSLAAARKLDIVRSGTAKVRVSVVEAATQSRTGE